MIQCIRDPRRGRTGEPKQQHGTIPRWVIFQLCMYVCMHVCAYDIWDLSITYLSLIIYFPLVYLIINFISCFSLMNTPSN